MGNTHHAIDYIELGATDLPALRAFYETAFGWNFNDYGLEYAGIRAVGGDGEVGGLTTLRAPGAAGPLVLLYSRDLDASVGAVERAGGIISSGPYDFPGGAGSPSSIRVETNWVCGPKRESSRRSDVGDRSLASAREGQPAASDHRATPACESCGICSAAHG